MVAADAAEPDRATLPASSDVVGLQADAVGRGDFADSSPYVLGVEPLRLAPDAVTVTVELEGRDPIDGFASAVLAEQP